MCKLVKATYLILAISPFFSIQNAKAQSIYDPNYYYLAPAYDPYANDYWNQAARMLYEARMQALRTYYSGHSGSYFARSYGTTPSYGSGSPPYGSTGSYGSGSPTYGSTGSYGSGSPTYGSTGSYGSGSSTYGSTGSYGSGSPAYGSGSVSGSYSSAYGAGDQITR